MPSSCTSPRAALARAFLAAGASLAAPALHAQTCEFPGFSLAPISTATGATGGVQNIAVGGSPTYVLLHDFDRDDRLDLATANLGGDTVTVHLGNGDGTFAPAPGSPIAMPASPTTNGSRPNGLAAGDFDGDGTPDVVVALRNSGKVMLLHGNGDGTFVPTAPIAAGPGGSTPQHIAKGDFNADGKLDVAVALNGMFVSGGVVVLLGDGAGQFATAPGSPMIIAGNGATGIVAGQFTGSPAPDLAYTVGGTRQVVVVRGNGDGSFTAAQQINTPVPGTTAYPIDLAAADVNSDGRLDLVVADLAPRASGAVPPPPGNDVVVLLQNAGGSFDAPVRVGAGVDVVSVATGDFNSDGRPDFVAANAAWSFSGTVRLGDGTANFATAPASYAAGGNPYHVAVGDLNGDGSPDFVVVNQPSNTLSAYLYDCVPDNHAPVANPDGGGDFTTDKNAAFNTAGVLANDTDADGHALSVSSVDTVGTLGTVTYNGNGTFHYDPNGMFAQLGPFDSAIDTFRYTVTDGHGLFATTTVTITVLGAWPVDLQVQVPELPAPLVAGTVFQIPVGAQNLSSRPAGAVAVTATLSPNLAVADPGVCSSAGLTVTCAIGTLPGFGNASSLLTLRVRSDATGNAQVDFGVSGDAPDPVAANNTGTALAPVALLADAGIGVDNGTTALVPGEISTYAVTVTNAGPSDIAEAAVLLDPPSELGDVQWTCAASGGGSCAASGSGGIDDDVALPAGAQLVYAVQGRLSPAFAGESFSLTATVVSAVDDPGPGNETATDTDAVTITGDASVGLDLSASFAVMNRLSRYVVLVGNSGPSQMSGLEIGSAAPTGLTAVVWSCTTSGGASCGGSGTGALADTITLPPGASVRYTVTGITTSTQDYLDVNAALTIPIGVQDTQPANNSASISVPISLFRSGFEADELAPPASHLVTPDALGEQALAAPEIAPTALMQWQCGHLPCGYVVGVRQAPEARYTIVRRGADGAWQSSPWHRAPAAAHVIWAVSPDGTLEVALTDASGAALLPR